MLWEDQEKIFSSSVLKQHSLHTWPVVLGAAAFVKIGEKLVSQRLLLTGKDFWRRLFQKAEFFVKPIFHTIFSKYILNIVCMTDIFADPYCWY